LQGPETDPETVAYLKDRISVGLPLIVKLLIMQNGEKYWVSIQGQLYTTKTIKRYFAIEEDITARKILENQREELVNSPSSNKELEDYAHIVSHDLKSPLRSIHSLLSWIKEDNEDKLSQETRTILV
jgi:signal transduction histidine kinase